MVICIAGGIGAGKSVVSRILRLNGYAVYDCDLEARRLMENDMSLRKSLSHIAGSDIYDAAGNLDRSVMSTRIFGDENLRRKVNAYVHDAVRCDIVLRKERSGGNLMFVESAIPVTSGLDRMCDMIWLVEAPVSLRIERVMARNAMSRDAVLSRIESQKGEEAEIKKLGRSGCIRTEVIDNDDNASLMDRIINLLETADTARSDNAGRKCSKLTDSKYL